MARPERILVGAPAGPSARTVISSPFHFQVEASDLIRLRIWFLNYRTWAVADRVFALIVRSVRLTGESQVSEMLTAPATKQVANTTWLPLEAGTIQTVSLSYAGTGLTVFPGLAYGAVDLVRGTQAGAQKVIGTFLAGYVAPGLPRTWPGSPILGPAEGAGYPVSFPAVGVVGEELSFTLGDAEYWLLRAVRATYVASAVGANRRPRLQVTVGGVLVGLCSSPQDITASQTVETLWMPGASLSVGSALRDGVAPMPADLVLRSGDTVTTSTVARQAGDQYNPVVISASAYLEPIL